MVVIRLSREGAKKRPFYHIIVTDERNRRDGKSIEQVGYFNPNATGKEVRLHMKTDRITHWRQWVILSVFICSRTSLPVAFGLKYPTCSIDFPSRRLRSSVTIIW